MYSLFTLMFSFIAVSCQVWFLFAVVDDVDANADVLSRLLTAAAVCDLVVIGASMLRTLVDGMDVLRALHRHVQLLITASRSSYTHSSLALNAVSLTAVDVTDHNSSGFFAADAIVDDDNADALLLAEFDSAFWTRDGGAAVLLDNGASDEEEGIATATEEVVQHNQNDLLNFFDVTLESVHISP
ncbi:membrane-associated protein, putative [Bodo saltans]|uniref:Membrane-associated protein, putative n=1 Tax=Bodo saltans TaxID=75058 RepID=A0A0S4JPG8_BODSA|nr:membrane-associated protein, putative [Bodo saltans]|eukprot:CUG92071.1 membrane-associated protein, putative [Bodo saltans]